MIVCPICRDQIADDECVVLQCQCKTPYHYDCMYKNYLASSRSNGCLSEIDRRCPYCQTNGGFLPLHAKYRPMYGVHFLFPPKGVDLGLGLDNYCHASIVSKYSKQHNQKCGKKSGNVPFCRKHHNLLRLFLSDALDTQISKDATPQINLNEPIELID